MRTIAIVQARMGSSRLPGKVLRELAGKPMLSHVVDRVRLAKSVDGTCVATSEATGDDLIVAHCRDLDVPCFRGSEADVLDRFARAAAATDADVIVRITADCPLLDPEVIDAVVDSRAKAGWDYGSNTGTERTFPRGLDCEVMTRSALDVAAREAVDPAEREHVTLFLYRRPERFSIGTIRSPLPAADHRWTVDTLEDFELASAILAALPIGATKWTDALAVVESNPSLRAINEHVRQKSV